MSLVIEEVRGLGDPQRSYKWRVTLPFLNSNLQNKQKDFLSSAPRIRNTVLGAANRLPPIFQSALDDTKFGSRINSFNPSNFVEEVQGLPFPNVDREAFYEGGKNTYFPGIEDMTPFSVVFYQNETSSVQDYLIQWKRQVVNPDGTKNYPTEYKKTIRVQLLDGRNDIVFDYRLIGCYPTQSAPYNLTNTSDRITFTQEFSVDRMEITADTRKDNSSNLADKLKQITKDTVESKAAGSINSVGTSITDRINRRF